MTKEEAIKAADNILSLIYVHDIEIVATISKAAAEGNVEYLYHTLNKLVEFIEEVKKTLKKTYKTQKL